MERAQYYIGADIGGSHITTGLVRLSGDKLFLERSREKPLNSSGPLEEVIEDIAGEISHIVNEDPASGLALSFPGPFLYERGICGIQAQCKYDHCFGADLKTILWSRLNGGTGCGKPSFINDAEAFLLGAVNEYGWHNERVLAITLGTGLGSAFYDRGAVLGPGALPDGSYLYNKPFKDGVAEDYISTRWILKRYRELTGNDGGDVKSIASGPDDHGRRVFAEMGEHLAAVLLPVLREFKPTGIVFGGNISKSFALFKHPFIDLLSMNNKPSIRVADDTSALSVKGAVAGHLSGAGDLSQAGDSSQPSNKLAFRKTRQPLLPARKSQPSPPAYDIFPAYPLQPGQIQTGYNSLAEQLRGSLRVVIDGYSGVNWEHFVENLDLALREQGVTANWFCADVALKEESEIDRMLGPYLGGDDPVFGRLFPGELGDFFDQEKLDAIHPAGSGLNILYGCGAALANWEGPVYFLDVPKNEIQYRSRAEAVCNIGALTPLPPRQQYKRFFFVDWVVLNKHKKALLPLLSGIADQQRFSEITWMEGNAFREALKAMSANVFRARPWFEAGAWGGDWMKQRIEGLPQDERNYAWSFELISPENGIVLESDGNLLEVSFDFLLYQDNKAILGKAAACFGDQFPIRFDFLDTFNGGNLSLQCHPGNGYIKEHFGENFTQDETYYILDAGAGAEVYLGFREGISETDFRTAIEKSAAEHVPVDTEAFIQVFPARKHDLFLIPNRTVHCSGVNNLVLEISSTPYIYTFKLYDWLRMDLDGKPRPLNIKRGFENLDFSRSGDRVKQELISVPRLVQEGADWKTLELPTHPEHFYRIQRLEFSGEMTLDTAGQAHILSLVEGGPVRVVTGSRQLLVQYAETFVIPAAAGPYRFVNQGLTPAKIVRAFVRDEYC